MSAPVVSAIEKQWQETDPRPRGDLLADLAAKAARITELEAALAVLIYETTHLSPLNDDGSHWCKISREALAKARTLLAGGKRDG